MSTIKRAKSTTITPKLVNATDSPRQAASNFKHVQVNGVYQHHFRVAIKTRIEIEGMLYPTSQTQPALPTLDLATWPDATFEKAYWVGQWFAGGSGTDAADTGWVNANNVASTEVRMGYVGGGEGWYAAANSSTYFRAVLERYDANRTWITWRHQMGRRGSNGTVLFDFNGVWQKKIEDLTDIGVLMQGQMFNASFSYKLF